MKFNVHSGYAKQVIVLNVEDGQTDGRTMGIRQNFG